MIRRLIPAILVVLTFLTIGPVHVYDPFSTVPLQAQEKIKKDTGNITNGLSVWYNKEVDIH